MMNTRHQNFSELTRNNKNSSNCFVYLSNTVINRICSCIAYVSESILKFETVWSIFGWIWITIKPYNLIQWYLLDCQEVLMRDFNYFDASNRIFFFNINNLETEERHQQHFLLRWVKTPIIRKLDTSARIIRTQKDLENQRWVFFLSTIRPINCETFVFWSTSECWPVVNLVFSVIYQVNAPWSTSSVDWFIIVFVGILRSYLSNSLDNRGQITRNICMSSIYNG